MQFVTKNNWSLRFSRLNVLQHNGGNPCFVGDHYQPRFIKNTPKFNYNGALLAFYRIYALWNFELIKFIIPNWLNEINFNVMYFIIILVFVLCASRLSPFTHTFYHICIHVDDVNRIFSGGMITVKHSIYIYSNNRKHQFFLLIFQHKL